MKRIRKTSRTGTLVTTLALAASNQKDRVAWRGEGEGGEQSKETGSDALDWNGWRTEGEETRIAKGRRGLQRTRKEEEA